MLFRSVQEKRDDRAGHFGRALLRIFQQQFRAPEALWWKAIEWLLAKRQVIALDPGDANQANVGPLLLELGLGARPQLVFFPSYSPDRLPSIVHRLHGAAFSSTPDKILIVHNGQTLCSIAMPRADRPQLFGLGDVDLPPVTDLPAKATFDQGTRDLFESAFAQVTNSFAAEVNSGHSIRFTVPDLLRSVFFSMAEPAARAFLSGPVSQWIYSDQVRAVGFQVLPHQDEIKPGQLFNSQGDGVFFPDASPDGRVAFFI